MSEPVVHATSGAVRGRWRGPSAAFLGIPFAEAPVGPLRFAAPVRRSPWDGVRDATVYGPTAQVEPLTDITTIPEPSTPGDDVLNLNVFTPDPGAAGLPVLVWIHGGGYMAGCQNSSWYDGATFNRDGVVTVSTGYRLGAEAWLHLEGAPDNRGALDWVAALEWVRDNIAAFGGDPSRVTVAGQSAGGGAVLDLLAMPRAKGLFHRAMGISSALGDEDPARAAALAREFAALADVPATAEDMGQIDRRGLHAVTKRLSAGPGGGVDVKLAPFADGDVIPSPVLTALRSGEGHVPLLLGATSHEFNMAGGAAAGWSVTETAHALAGLGVPAAEAARLAADYADRPGEIFGQAVTDATFRHLAVAVVQARGAAAPTWLYQFDWRSRAPGMVGQAFHCLDLPFWWDRLDGERVHAATGDDPPQRLATAMHAAMVAFVSGGDPGWPAGVEQSTLWQDPPTSEPGYQSVITVVRPDTAG
ncbi:MAG: carboxylesterase family protein [Propionibacteriaceae bacterium]|jgi:para-nitrobenzyl esterase|nr:carboxylesterase family protein [Propionibacteriaceae bacterium]